MVAIVAASSPAMDVISLTRYAVKGLAGDNLQTATINRIGDTFPDDRRFALLKCSKSEIAAFDPDHPAWIHKENFLCAFSRPELMATFDTEYIVNDSEGKSQKLLTIWKRDNRRGRRPERHLLGPIDISTAKGRDQVSSFFTQACGECVEMVTSGSAEHDHQFGNTRSGVRERGDTRTIHLINAATVRQVSNKLGVELRPSRFRPNIIVDGLEPWKEFDFVGKTLRVQHVDCSEDNRFALDVISRTVRCDGVGVDPLDDPPASRLDIPKLLAEHFPEHGPYLGVYAATAGCGTISVGDTLQLV